MKRVFAVLAGLVALVVVGLSLATPASASTQRATSVPPAPITCIYEDGCVLAFVANNGNGYVMARQQDDVVDPTWVRLTMVPGWDNSFVGPITCKYSNSCVYDYTAGEGNGGYWRFRQASDTAPYTWVRVTQYGI